MARRCLQFQLPTGTNAPPDHGWAPPRQQPDGAHAVTHPAALPQVLGDRSMKIKHLNRHALLLAWGAAPGSPAAAAAPEDLHLQAPAAAALSPSSSPDLCATLCAAVYAALCHRLEPRWPWGCCHSPPRRTIALELRHMIYMPLSESRSCIGCCCTSLNKPHSARACSACRRYLWGLSTFASMRNAGKLCPW